MCVAMLFAVARVGLVVPELIPTLRTSVAFVHFTSSPFIRPY